MASQKTSQTNENTLVSVAELSKILNCSIQSVYEITKKEILKSETVKGQRAKKYSLANNVLAYVKHLQERLNNKDNISEALKQADLAKKELQLRELENKLALQEGNLHTTEDVCAVWDDFMGVARTRLYALPSSLSEKVLNISNRVEATKIIKQEIYEVANLMMGYNANEFYKRNPEYKT